MNENSDILAKIKELEQLRNGISTFIYFGVIGGLNLIKARKSLSNVLKKEAEVDIIINSGGGSADDAYRLIRLFRNKYHTVNIIVPFWCKSAATLFSFGANRLVLHEFGELGPIDVQVKKDTETDPEGEWSSALNVQASLLQIEARSREGMLEMFNRLRSTDNTEILKIGRKQLAEMLLDYSAKFYQPLLQKVEAIELGTMARSLDVGRMYAMRILKQYTNTEDNKIRKLIEFLTYDCPDHGYSVDYNILKSYLDFVIRPDEEPFTEEYNKKLNDLSILSMFVDSDCEMVGFLKDFPPKDNSDIINKKDEKSKSNQKREGEIIDDRGPIDKPREDFSKRSVEENSKNA